MRGRGLARRPRNVRPDGAHLDEAHLDEAHLNEAHLNARLDEANLDEARGDLEAPQWRTPMPPIAGSSSGSSSSKGFALLGQGRCLLGLSLPTEATPVLQHAREIFQRLQAAPALAETDRLLQQATALSS